MGSKDEVPYPPAHDVLLAHHPPPQSAREYQFLKTPAPLSAEPTFRDKFNKEWRARWWLWTALIFALVVFGGLFAFRESLYTQNTGMPLLAVTENAQELCDAKCASEVGVDTDGQAANKEKYEACLALCVKGETEQVAEERQEFAEEQAKEAEEEKAAEVAADPAAAAAAEQEKIKEESAKLEAAAEAEVGVRRRRMHLL